MAAEITASGTWSALDDSNPTSQAPGANVNEVIRQHRETFEQRFQPRSLDYKNSFPDDVDGLQEVMQFVGLFAAGYSVPSGVAAQRIADIIAKAYFNTDELTDQRVYEP